MRRVQISCDICTRFARHLYSTKQCWIINIIYTIYTWKDIYIYRQRIYFTDMNKRTSGLRFNVPHPPTPIPSEKLANAKMTTYVGHFNDLSKIVSAHAQYCKHCTVTLGVLDVTLNSNALQEIFWYLDTYWYSLYQNLCTFMLNLKYTPTFMAVRDNHKTDEFGKLPLINRKC